MLEFEPVGVPALSEEVAVPAAKTGEAALQHPAKNTLLLLAVVVWLCGGNALPVKVCVCDGISACV